MFDRLRENGQQLNARRGDGRMDARGTGDRGRRAHPLGPCDRSVGAGRQLCGAPHSEPEFVSQALLSWIVAQGIDTALIDPGKPWQNANLNFKEREMRPAHSAKTRAGTLLSVQLTVRPRTECAQLAVSQVKEGATPNLQERPGQSSFNPAFRNPSIQCSRSNSPP